MLVSSRLSQSAIDAGEQITLTEGGKTLNFTTREGETVEQTLNRLGDAIKGSGLALCCVRTRPRWTVSCHKRSPAAQAVR